MVSGPGRLFFTGELFFSGQGTGEKRKNKHDFRPALAPGFGPIDENGSLKVPREVNKEGFHRKDFEYRPMVHEIRSIEGEKHPIWYPSGKKIMLRPGSGYTDMASQDR